MSYNTPYSILWHVSTTMQDKPTGGYKQVESIEGIYQKQNSHTFISSNTGVAMDPWMGATLYLNSLAYWGSNSFIQQEMAYDEEAPTSKNHVKLEQG